jgi:hypothetical protein
MTKGRRQRGSSRLSVTVAVRTTRSTASASCGGWPPNTSSSRAGPRIHGPMRADDPDRLVQDPWWVRSTSEPWSHSLPTTRCAPSPLAGWSSSLREFSTRRSPTKLWNHPAFPGDQLTEAAVGVSRIRTQGVGPRPAVVGSCVMIDRATGRTLPSSPSAPNDTLRRSVRVRADLRAGCRPATLGGAAPTGSAEPSIGAASILTPSIPRHFGRLRVHADYRARVLERLGEALRISWPRRRATGRDYPLRRSVHESEREGGYRVVGCR